jgi:integral membrane protein (TIGR01906 family)
MRGTPRLAALLFGLAIGILILLLGPLLLFNPPFVSTLQARHDVAARFGTTHDEIDRVTGEVLGDLFTDGDFAVSLDGAPLLDGSERSHMADVSRLVRILVTVAVVSAIVATLCGVLLRGQPRLMATTLVVTASLIGGAGVVLAIVFVVAFEPAFLAFHAVFFPPGTYLFEPGSNLIELFPEGFWFEASLVAGLTVVLSALAVLAIGLAGRRRPPAPLATG